MESKPEETQRCSTTVEEESKQSSKDIQIDELAPPDDIVVTECVIEVE